MQMTPDEFAASDEAAAARRAHPLADQSAAARPPCRRSMKSRNGLSYYDHTFSARVAAPLSADSRTSLAAFDPAWQQRRAALLHAHGQLDRRRPRRQPLRRMPMFCGRPSRMQSKRVFDFYLDELHLLGAELSLDSARVSISAQLAGTGRSARPTNRRGAPPSPTGARSSASTRGYSRRRGRSGSRFCRATPP